MNIKDTEEYKSTEALLGKISAKQALEEAAKEFANNSATCDYEEGINVGKYQGFCCGAEWQQDRMYNEEELKEAYLAAIQSTGEGWNGEYAGGNNPDINEKFTEGFDEWFTRFKKK
jgi:hypothetical protein